MQRVPQSPQGNKSTDRIKPNSWTRYSTARTDNAPITIVKKPHEIQQAGCKVIERKKLHQEIWAKPAMHVATGYGISGSMLARICTQLQIPRPPRGYWAKPKVWRQKHKKRLPKWKGEGADYWVVNPINAKAQRHYHH